MRLTPGWSLGWCCKVSFEPTPKFLWYPGELYGSDPAFNVSLWDFSPVLLSAMQTNSKLDNLEK